ncbi:hypothetical protein GCM10018952_32170 [Streptosporangium vulgare]
MMGETPEVVEISADAVVVRRRAGRASPPPLALLRAGRTVILTEEYELRSRGQLTSQAVPP